MRTNARVLVCLGALLLPSLAAADANDLVLARLANCIDGAGAVVDCATAGARIVPNNQEFRSLMSEFGVATAPPLLAPSDTLGYSGFQYSGSFSFTTISNTHTYWCATEESGSCSAGFERSSIVPVLHLQVSKGMWLPMPSFEIGAGATHVLDSQMWTGTTWAKFAIHEGFHGWPIPSLAVRGAASRLMGSRQVDLTVASLDISLSKEIGVQGTFNLAPYAGWNYLWIVPRSEVIDKTPEVDMLTTPGDLRNLVFPTQDNIIRNRFFVGFKLKYYVFAWTTEVAVALAGNSMDDRAGVNLRCDAAREDELSNCDAVDKAAMQTTVSTSLSMDF